MDRNLALEVVRVTEAAALAAARFVGRGDRDGADRAATEAMRKTFSFVHVRGRVVIGEGERDEAPMLYIGEPVGDGAGDAPEVDIAVDPLEGTNLVADGLADVLAAAALRCVGGEMRGVLKPRNGEERDRAAAMGIADLDHVFAIDELARGDVMFAATGVTEGFLLRGVRPTAAGADTHSIVMRSRSGTVRFLQTRHRFEGHPVYGAADHGRDRPR